MDTPIDPVTTSAVAGHLSLVEDDTDVNLQAAVDAVNDLLAEWIAPDRLTRRSVIHGGVMLAARVYRRRNSPAGVEALGEMGPVYVSRNDPDLAMMLGLGNYRKPMVG